MRIVSRCNQNILDKKKSWNSHLIWHLVSVCQAQNKMCICICMQILQNTNRNIQAEIRRLKCSWNLALCLHKKQNKSLCKTEIEISSAICFPLFHCPRILGTVWFFTGIWQSKYFAWSVGTFVPFKTAAQKNEIIPASCSQRAYNSLKSSIAAKIELLYFCL